MFLFLSLSFILVFLVQLFYFINRCINNSTAFIPKTLKEQEFIIRQDKETLGFKLYIRRVFYGMKISMPYLKTEYITNGKVKRTPVIFDDFDRTKLIAYEMSQTSIDPTIKVNIRIFNPSVIYEQNINKKL
jgi:hypothetical protein